MSTRKKKLSMALCALLCATSLSLTGCQLVGEHPLHPGNIAANIAAAPVAVVLGAWMVLDLAFNDGDTFRFKI